jgi:hypothetical protein
MTTHILHGNALQNIKRKNALVLLQYSKSVTARHSQHIYSAIKIRKCRKGTSELENIVYMAYIWQLFPLASFDHTLFEYCNNTSAFFLLNLRVSEHLGFYY